MGKCRYDVDFAARKIADYGSGASWNRMERCFPLVVRPRRPGTWAPWPRG